MARVNASVCVLIPAYNEEKNIACVAGAVRDLGFTVLVVDDGSTDSTAKILQDLPGIYSILSPVNEGKGASLRKGFEWFLSSNSDVVVLMDADGQHSPDEVEVFVRALEAGADFVVGNRMHSPGRMPWLRRWTNRFMSALLSAASSQRIPDTQCGYRALKKDALQRLRLSTGRFEIESEMLLEAARLGLKIRSIPIRSVYEGGDSKINPFTDTIRFFSFLFKYRRRKGKI